MTEVEYPCWECRVQDFARSWLLENAQTGMKEDELVLKKPVFDGHSNYRIEFWWKMKDGRDRRSVFYPDLHESLYPYELNVFAPEPDEGEPINIHIEFLFHAENGLPICPACQEAINHAIYLPPIEQFEVRFKAVEGIKMYFELDRNPNSIPLQFPYGSDAWHPRMECPECNFDLSEIIEAHDWRDANGKPDLLSREPTPEETYELFIYAFKKYWDSGRAPSELRDVTNELWDYAHGDGES